MFSLITAAVYLSNMNRSVDPCENFYEYSCGGWKTKNIIAEDETSVSAFGKLDDDVGMKCKGKQSTNLQVVML